MKRFILSSLAFAGFAVFSVMGASDSTVVLNSQWVNKFGNRVQETSTIKGADVKATLAARKDRLEAKLNGIKDKKELGRTICESSIGSQQQ